MRDVPCRGSRTRAGLRPRPRGRSVALAVLMVVLFLTFLDNTVVSVALGSVQSMLHAGVTAAVRAPSGPGRGRQCHGG